MNLVPFFFIMNLKDRYLDTYEYDINIKYIYDKSRTILDFFNFNIK